MTTDYSKYFRTFKEGRLYFRYIAGTELEGHGWTGAALAEFLERHGFIKRVTLQTQNERGQWSPAIPAAYYELPGKQIRKPELHAMLRQEMKVRPTFMHSVINKVRKTVLVAALAITATGCASFRAEVGCLAAGDAEACEVYRMHERAYRNPATGKDSRVEAINRLNDQWSQPQYTPAFTYGTPTQYPDRQPATAPQWATPYQPCVMRYDASQSGYVTSGNCQ